MPRLSATAADLPPAVAAELERPTRGEPGAVEVGGRRWTFIAWGRASDPPLLLVHGVTSNAGIWWRVGPALATSGRRVVAVDMPGHGPGAVWHGRHRFTETADDLAGFIRSAHLDVPNLAMVGHSWGGMVSAHLPGSGIRPAVLVLIDPPAATVAEFEEYVRDPSERPYSSLEAATAAVRTENPGWSEGDVAAKATALIEFDTEAVRAVLLQNGDWDAGMAALRHSAAAGLPAWLIRGEEANGGFIPESAVPAIEAQLGPDRVVTIVGAPHSPQRTHPQATVLAILRAIG